MRVGKIISKYNYTNDNIFLIRIWNYYTYVYMDVCVSNLLPVDTKYYNLRDYYLSQTEM